MLLLALATYSRLFLVWVKVLIVLLVLTIVMLLKIVESPLPWVASLVILIVILVILVLILVLVFVLVLLVSLLFSEFVDVLDVGQLLRQAWGLKGVI